jgi:hypothetical protein
MATEVHPDVLYTLTNNATPTLKRLGSQTKAPEAITSFLLFLLGCIICRIRSLRIKLRVDEDQERMRNRFCSSTRHTNL